MRMLTAVSALFGAGPYLHCQSASRTGDEDYVDAQNRYPQHDTPRSSDLHQRDFSVALGLAIMVDWIGWR